MRHRSSACLLGVLFLGCKFPELPPIDEDAIGSDASTDARVDGFVLNALAPVWIRLDGTQTVPITVTRDPAFTDAITIALDDAPSGIAASSAEIPPGATQINLLVSATAATGAVAGASGTLHIVGMSGSIRRETDADVLVAGAAGALDASFGNGGFALGATGMAMASQIHAETYVVSGVAVSRFLLDGSLDTSFGGTGTVTPDFAPLGAQGQVYMCAAVQSDGNIVVVGTGDGDPESTSIRYDLFVLRLRSDGSTDATFTGRHHTATPDFLAMNGCRVGPNDEIIVFGGATSFGGDGFLLRMLPDGSLDTTFGPNGRQRVDPVPSYSHGVTAVDIDMDGNIIATMESYIQGGSLDGNGLVMRYLRSGGQDLAFGGDGVVDLTAESSGATYSSADSVIAVPGGMLIGGSVITSSGTEVAIWKLQSSGAWAPGFALGGVWRRTSTPPSSITAMSLDDDGSIFAASLRYQNFQAAGLLFHHLSANGVPDSAWGTNGTIATMTNFRIKAAHRTLRRIAFAGDSGGSIQDRMGAVRIWY